MPWVQQTRQCCVREQGRCDTSKQTMAWMPALTQALDQIRATNGRQTVILCGKSLKGRRKAELLMAFSPNMTQSPWGLAQHHPRLRMEPNNVPVALQCGSPRQEKQGATALQCPRSATTVAKSSGKCTRQTKSSRLHQKDKEADSYRRSASTPVRAVQRNLAQSCTHVIL